MEPSKNQPKRRPTQARPGAESLERREVMTGGAGNTIALIPATISKPNVPTTIDVKVDSTLFKMSKKGTLTLGIDVAKQTGSTVSPKIKSVSVIQGATAQSLGTVAGAKTKNVKFTRQNGSTAVLVPVSWEKGRTSKSVIIRATVVGDKGSTGGLLAGYYLPGDVNGDGLVDRSDIKLIRKQVGLNASNANYQFDADANRDGKIDSKDLSAAQANLGAVTVVTPVVTANIDSSAIVNGSRTTTADAVQFTGVATPGSTITYSDTSGKNGTSAAVVDSSGNYSVKVPLSIGENVYQVTTNDGFGQSISGTISPVARTAVNKA